jgi:capsular exopolysaccharide synthesis family protein
MNIKSIINILIRRKWAIILVVVVTMVVIVIGTRLQTPIFQASTTLRIATSSLTQTSYQDYIYSDRLMNTYIEISASEAVQTELMKRLNLTKPPTIKSEILPNTELIKITIEDTDPNMATNEANTLADILITQSSQLYTGGGLSSQKVLGDQLTQANEKLIQIQQDYQKLLIQTPAVPDQIEVARQELTLQQNTYSTLLYQYNQASISAAMQANMVTIVDRAKAPQSPSRPRPIVNYALGLIIGLLGGLGMALLLENLDTTVHSLDEIESFTKLITLAKITKANKKQIDISKNDKSPFAVDFLNLATKIELINHEQTRKVLLIMSPEPRQGKSMIVSNLAYALAESGKKVVAVDCDLHLPQLHRLFHLSNKSGLSDDLERKINYKYCLQKCQYNGVTLLASGPLPDFPPKVLGSSRMAKLIDELKQEYDYVLIDSPAMLSFADVEILVQYADGLIMVVRQAYARREAIQTGVRFLALYPNQAIGCIANQTTDDGNYGYYSRHYSQHRLYSDKMSEKPKSSAIFGQTGKRKLKKDAFLKDGDLNQERKTEGIDSSRRTDYAE